MSTIQADIARRQWTVLSLIQWGADYFSSRGMESPRYTMELLLCHALKLSRVNLYLNFDRPLTAGELSAVRQLVHRRLGHEPVQYITGTSHFMDLELLVTPDVLIPRPETELLAEEAQQIVRQHGYLSVLDLCTGSGNIAIALAAKNPSVTVEAVDVSDNALEIARRNVSRHGVGERVQLILGNILDKSWHPPAEKYQLIISNPPYVSAAEYALLEPGVRNFEPSLALTDGGDGLSFYRVIAQLAEDFLDREGTLIVEIAYNQLTSVYGIFSDAGFRNIRHRLDDQRHPRIVVAER